jgi:hypothetical protein
MDRMKNFSVNSVCSNPNLGQKNFEILIILASIHSKHNMEMTNMTIVFHQIPPREREREAESGKKGEN